MDGKTPDADTLRAAIERHQRELRDAFLHGTARGCTNSATRGESPLLTLDRLRDAMAELPAPPVLAGVPIMVSEYVPTEEDVEVRDERSLLRRIFSGHLCGIRARTVKVDHVFLLERDEGGHVLLASPGSAAVLKSYPAEVVL